MKKRTKPSYPLGPRGFGDGDTQWFYETMQGLCVVAEVRDTKGYLGTTNVTVPWRMVCAAVANHVAVKAKRRIVAR